MPHFTSISWGRRLSLVALLATLAVALGLGFGVGPHALVAHASGACSVKLKATSPKYNLPFDQGYLIAYVYGEYYADGSFCGSYASGVVHLNAGANPGGMNVRLYDCGAHVVAGADADADQNNAQYSGLTDATCVHAQVRFWYDANPHSIYEVHTDNVALVGIIVRGETGTTADVREG